MFYSNRRPVLIPMFPEVFGRLRANVIGMHKSADSALVSEFEAPLGGGVKPSQGTGTSFVILAATTTMSTVAQWAKTNSKSNLLDVVRVPTFIYKSRGIDW